MKKEKRKLYTVDFETLTEESVKQNNDTTRIWAFGMMNIFNESEYYECTTMEEAVALMCENAPCTCYYHNVKFDSSYLLDYFLKNGYEWVEERKDLAPYKFTTLISDTGVFYSLEFMCVVKGVVKSVKILGSEKLIPGSVDKIAKDLKLPILKLEIDYNLYREVGHQLTKEESEYLKHDVWIMALALRGFFEKGYTKMTIGGCSLNEYKKIITEEMFSRTFPVLEEDVDWFCRQSYKGGWTYKSDFMQDEIGFFMVFDVNSLYPSRMRYCLMPWGQPIYYKGNYEKDDKYPLYIQHIFFEFELKPNHLPCIQLKHTRSFAQNEYLHTSNGELVELFVTNVDLDLIKDQYNIYNVTYVDGMKFRGAFHLFDTFIDKFAKEKIMSKENDDTTGYLSSKLIQNNLYGKFGTNPLCGKKRPYLGDDNCVHFEMLPEEVRDSVYVPIACFTTAYGRALTIRTAQEVEDNYFLHGTPQRFLYADTDSIHITTTDFEIPRYIDCDSYKLGKWDLELIGCKARYIRQKTYIELAVDKDELEKLARRNGLKLDKFTFSEFCSSNTPNKARLVEKAWKRKSVQKVTCAGMSAKLHDKVTFDNFIQGTVYNGNLKSKRIDGGVILLSTDFKIK